MQGFKKYSELIEDNDNSKNGCFLFDYIYFSGVERSLNTNLGLQKANIINASGAIGLDLGPPEAGFGATLFGNMSRLQFSHDNNVNSKYLESPVIGNYTIMYYLMGVDWSLFFGNTVFTSLENELNQNKYQYIFTYDPETKTYKSKIDRTESFYQFKSAGYRIGSVVEKSEIKIWDISKYVHKLQTNFGVLHYRDENQYIPYFQVKVKIRKTEQVKQKLVRVYRTVYDRDGFTVVKKDVKYTKEAIVGLDTYLNAHRDNHTSGNISRSTLVFTIEKKDEAGTIDILSDGTYKAKIGASYCRDIFQEEIWGMYTELTFLKMGGHIPGEIFIGYSRNYYDQLVQFPLKDEGLAMVGVRIGLPSR